MFETPTPFHSSDRILKESFAINGNVFVHDLSAPLIFLTNKSRKAILFTRQPNFVHLDAFKIWPKRAETEQEVFSIHSRRRMSAQKERLEVCRQESRMLQNLVNQLSDKVNFRNWRSQR